MKRYNADFEDEATSGIEGRGYESFGGLAKDLEAVIDVVWVSGTRTISQTSTLVNILKISLPTQHRYRRPTCSLSLLLPALVCHHSLSNLALLFDCCTNSTWHSIHSCKVRMLKQERYYRASKAAEES